MVILLSTPSDSLKNRADNFRRLKYILKHEKGVLFFLSKNYDTKKVYNFFDSLNTF